MTNFRRIIGFVAVVAVIGLLVTACDLDPKRVTGSIIVNDQKQISRSARSSSEPEIELYIHYLKYQGNLFENDGGWAFRYGIAIVLFDEYVESIPKENRGGQHVNEGWFSIGGDFPLQHEPGVGLHEFLHLGVRAMRINGIEYPFPGIVEGRNRRWVTYGTTICKRRYDPPFAYLFDGIMITSNTTHIETTICVDIERIGEFWDIVTDPSKPILYDGKDPYELITIIGRSF